MLKDIKMSMTNYQHKLIYIEWADAYTCDDWKTLDECFDWANDYKWIVKSVGWVLKETDKYILLASKKK